MNDSWSMCGTLTDVEILENVRSILEDEDIQTIKSNNKRGGC